MVFRKEPSVTEKIQLPYQSSKNVESNRPALQLKQNVQAREDY